jgi:hypothetical protein
MAKASGPSPKLIANHHLAEIVGFDDEKHPRPLLSSDRGNINRFQGPSHGGQNLMRCHGNVYKSNSTQTTSHCLNTRIAETKNFSGLWKWTTPERPKPMCMVRNYRPLMLVFATGERFTKHVTSETFHPVVVMCLLKGNVVTLCNHSQEIFELLFG